jgi:nucleotide-binding universal stress UspA family protein
MDTDSTVILVADDFTEPGRLALEQALVLASPLEAQVHVVHVLTKGDIDAANGSTEIERLDHLLSRVPNEIWQRVQRAGEHPACRGALSVTVHVRNGTPAEEIDRIAADYGAHLIVVGTHGRKGLDRLALGSVAEKLVRTAHCPVLVARLRDYSGVRTSDFPEPARPGEDMSRQRPEGAHVYRSTQWMSFRKVETEGIHS